MGSGGRSTTRSCWPGSVPSCAAWRRLRARGFRSLGRTRTLDSHASRLRRKLSAAGGDYVRNVWGVGYSLSNDSM
jgi:hypothetical protein